MSSAVSNNLQDATIGYYDRHAAAFVEDTARADVSEILDAFVSVIPAEASVLDWGCGTGRDSRALCDRGFAVRSIDASQAMCDAAKELFGIDATCERFGDLDADARFDGIWACASLLHVPKGELPVLFSKAHGALAKGGVLYASFKYGNFEGMRGGRWYTDLDEQALVELVDACFDVVRMWVTGDVRPGRAGEKWLNCLLQKRS